MMKTRRDFLKAAGISAVGLACYGSNAISKSNNKPNIIYIMLDELGYFELSCMGHVLDPSKGFKGHKKD